MKNSYLLLIIFVFILLLGGWLYLDFKKLPSTNSNSSILLEQPDGVKENPRPVDEGDLTGFGPPLDNSSERVTKKPFGKYITPADSPVQPERFSGYHTGADFEVFSNEINTN